MDQEGKIWIGTEDGGLSYMNSTGETFTHINASKLFLTYRAYV